MTTHLSILARKISWTEEPGRLQSIGSQESDTTWQLNKQICIYPYHKQINILKINNSSTLKTNRKQKFKDTTLKIIIFNSIKHIKCPVTIYY